MKDLGLRDSKRDQAWKLRTMHVNSTMKGGKIWGGGRERERELQRQACLKQPKY